LGEAEYYGKPFPNTDKTCHFFMLLPIFSQPVSLGGAITVGGRQYHLVGDELGLDSDEDGDKKIDAKGRLQGGEFSRSSSRASTLSDSLSLFRLIRF